MDEHCCQQHSFGGWKHIWAHHGVIIPGASSSPGNDGTLMSPKMLPTTKAVLLAACTGCISALSLVLISLVLITLAETELEIAKNKQTIKLNPGPMHTVCSKPITRGSGDDEEGTSA